LSTSQRRLFGIVDKHTGELLWGTKFETLGRAKLSVQHNNFILGNVGVAEIKDGRAVGPIEIYNNDSKKWEAVS
jgi:outer membrane protein assembly factor BamB